MLPITKSHLAVYLAIINLLKQNQSDYSTRIHLAWFSKLYKLMYKIKSDPKDKRRVTGYIDALHLIVQSMAYYKRHPIPTSFSFLTEANDVPIILPTGEIVSFGDYHNNMTSWMHIDTGYADWMNPFSIKVESLSLLKDYILELENENKALKPQIKMLKKSIKVESLEYIQSLEAENKALKQQIDVLKNLK